MKIFLKKIVLFAVILVFSCCAVVALHTVVVGNQYSQGYQAGIVDKMHRLRTIDEPKIILVGHSNLAFGIDSVQLEAALGMPVVNLGFHGAMANAFHENIAKEYINEGDVVVVCHSSFAGDATIYDGYLALTILVNCPEIAGAFQKEDYSIMLRSYPEYWRKSLFSWVTGDGTRIPEDSYARSAFNAYGDIVYRPESYRMEPDSFFSTAEVPLPAIDDACVERLNEYNHYITSRGATLVVAGYPIAYGKYSTFNEGTFDAFEELLRARLDCDVISHYTDYFYPYEFFYDTEMHLTYEGMTARTTQLIIDLTAWDPMRFSVP